MSNGCCQVMSSSLPWPLRFSVRGRELGMGIARGCSGFTSSPLSPFSSRSPCFLFLRFSSESPSYTSASYLRLLYFLTSSSLPLFPPPPSLNHLHPSLSYSLPFVFSTLPSCFLLFLSPFPSTFFTPPPLLPSSYEASVVSFAGNPRISLGMQIPRTLLGRSLASPFPFPLSLSFPSPSPSLASSL